MKRGVVVLLVLSLGAVTIAFGQDSTRKRVLTFEQAVTIALRNGVLLNQQRNNVDLNQIQKTSSLLSTLPSVSASATAQQFNGNSFNTSTGTVINGIRDGISGSLSANMNLFSGFYRINSIRQYSNLLDAQYYYVNRTAQDLMNTVATQYLQVMLDVELLRIGKENWNALKKQLLQVQGQVDEGAKAPVDGYNQSALTKAAELTYVQAEVTLVNDKALLAQTILMDAFEEFETERPNWDVNRIASDSLNAQQMADVAKANRGDYLRALKNEKGYAFGVKAARGLMLPNVTAFFNYGSQYNRQHGVPAVATYDSVHQSVVARNNTPSGYAIQNTVYQYSGPNSDVPQSFNQQFRFNNVYKQYGISLNVPIFNGFYNRVNLVTQKVQYENAVITRKNVEFQIKNDVVRAIKNYDGARKIYVITNDKLGYAKAALELETERYNLGVTSFVEFTNANRVLVQAQTDKAQAEYKLVFQKIMLGYAAGTLRPEDVTQQDNN